MKKTMIKACDAVTLREPTGGESEAGIETADQGRRRFLGLNLFGLALASTAGVFSSEIAWAGRTGRHQDDSEAVLDPSDPQAKALNYTPESAKAGQTCSNCQLYTGVTGQEFGPCAVFSYRVAPNGKQLMVDAAGWCRSWGPRQPL